MSQSLVWSEDLLFPAVMLTVSAGADEEAFEDNSEEYIRRDLEGSGKELSLPLSGRWWKNAPCCLTLVTIFPPPSFLRHRHPSKGSVRLGERPL